MDLFDMDRFLCLKSTLLANALFVLTDAFATGVKSATTRVSGDEGEDDSFFTESVLYNSLKDE
jgi:hypothetical protein